MGYVLVGYSTMNGLTSMACSSAQFLHCPDVNLIQLHSRQEDIVRAFSPHLGTMMGREILNTLSATELRAQPQKSVFLGLFSGFSEARSIGYKLQISLSLLKNQNNNK